MIPRGIDQPADSRPCGRMHALSAPAPKGGVGKTFTVANLIAALAELGHDVLGVDLDPQADLSASWGITEQHDAVRVEQLLASGEDPRPHALDVTPAGMQGSVRLLPASVALTELTGPLARQRYGQLDVLLDRFDGQVDFALIDTPAGVTAFGRAALVASTAAITPMLPGYLELRALWRLLSELDVAQAQLGARPEMLGVLFINTFQRSRMLREYRQHLHDQRTPVFDAFIRRAQRIGDHARYGQPTVVVEPSSEIAADIRAVARELVRRLADSPRNPTPAPPAAEHIPPTEIDSGPPIPRGIEVSDAA